MFVWGDEFNDSTLDTSKWQLRNENWWRKDRIHGGYRIRWRWEDDNVSLEDGNLVLTNTRETPFVDADDLVKTTGIDSRGRFEKSYGYFEARIKIAPPENGVHTAFWLNTYRQSRAVEGAVDGAEIDIMESPFTTNHYNVNVHWDGRKLGNSRMPFASMQDGEFHVFAVNWDARAYRFYADGALIHTYKGPGVSHSNQFVILSTGVSWRDGNAHTGTFSNQALVDWVRVWELKDDL